MNKNSDQNKVEQIIDAVMKVAAGDFTVQIDVSEKYDQLDALSMGINMMIDDLRNKYITDLENETIKKLNVELEQAKANAEESEARFDLAMGAAKDGIYDWNLITDEIYYSPGWKSMLGYKNNELPNNLSVWEKLTEPEDLAESWKMQQELIEKLRDQFKIEFKMKHKDGHWVDILSRAEVMFDKNGKAVRMVGTHVDISERKNAEKRYRKMFESMKAGVAVYSPIENGNDFIFLDFNKAAEKITNADRNKIIGKTLLSQFPNMNKSPFFKALQTVNETSKDMFLPAFSYKDAQREGWRENFIYKLSTGEIIAIFDDVTNHKNDEIELQNKNDELIKAKDKAEESEAKYKKLSNLTFEGIVLHQNGIAVDINLSFAQIFGYTREEVIGENIVKLIVKEEYHHIISQNIIKNYALSYEIVGIRKDGSELPLEVEARNVESDNKTTRVSAVRDISERKKAEVLLRNSESRFRMIYENSPILIDGFDENGRCILWNKSCEQTFGWSMAEINAVSEPLSLFYPDPEIRQQVIDSITLNPDNKFREFRPMTKTGDVLTCEWADFKLPDGTIMSIGNDITERKKTENALKLSEQRHRLLADNANDVLWTMNLEGRFTYVSPSVEKLRGYTSAEVMSQPLKEALTPESLEMAAKLLGEAIESIKLGIPFTERLLEFEQPCKDGSVIWTEATTSIIYNDEGEFVSILGITRDISDRKRNEQVQNILLNIANAVFTTDNVSELIGFIRTELNLLIDTTNLFVALYDSITDTFSLPYHEDEVDSFSSFPAAKTITQYVVETGQSLLANLDVLKNLEKAGKIERYGVDSLSWLGVPLKDGEQVVGAIVTQSYTNENAFNELDKDLLEIISAHINLAIHRKKEEEKLKESELRFKALHNATFGGIAIHDKGFILECNKGLANISGYTVDELIGMDGLLLIAEKNREKVKTNILSGDEKSYEATGLRKNGEEFPLRLEARMIPYEGEYMRVTEFRDITEQRKAEDVVRKLSTAVQQSPSIVVITDTNGNLEFVNPKFTELTGYSISEVIGQKSNILKSGEQDGGFYVEMWDTVSSGKEWRGQFHNKKKNGDLFWEAASISAILDESGKIINYIKIGEDITQQKQTETELKIALEKALESDRLKSAFLANMSHEIRTPMNGILGFINLLNEPDLSKEEIEEYSAVINRGGDRLLTTINDIIDISRIESGEMVVSKKEISLNSMMDELYSFYSPEVKLKGLFLLLKPANEELTINTDSHKLHGILTNLIKNAIKFTEEGSVTFGYLLKKDAIINEQGRSPVVEFFVEDTGSGVPKDRIQAIFKRFEQADTDDARSFQGSGLGLAISTAYVEMLGGEIFVESEHGKGSKFTFTIPYV